MVKINRVSGDTYKKYESLLSLYQEAFPEEERRDVDALIKLIRSEKRMAFCAIEYNETIAGLFVYWDFETFFYLEHLAVFESMRGKNIGGLLLDQINATFNKDKIMEVELPETEIATRRIGFYERHGYTVLKMSYAQPSYRQKGVNYPMLLMSDRPEVALHEMEQRVKIIEQVAYHID